MKNAIGSLCLLFYLLSVGITGCDGDSGGSGDADSDGDSDSGGDTDSDSDADSDGDSDGDSDVDSDGDSDINPECDVVVDLVMGAAPPQESDYIVPAASQPLLCWTVPDDAPILPLEDGWDVGVQRTDVESGLPEDAEWFVMRGVPPRRLGGHLWRMSS